MAFFNGNNNYFFSANYSSFSNEANLPAVIPQYVTRLKGLHNVKQKFPKANSAPKQINGSSGADPVPEPTSINAAQCDKPETEQTPPTNNNTTANIKEKTSMCLVNELARYNKIQHKYSVIDEKGPAHKKTFYVKLQLGNEGFDGTGPSIKKAQHSAAEAALKATSFVTPPPKSRTAESELTKRVNVTPTVELNALAMKRGESASYQVLSDQAMAPHPVVLRQNISTLAPGYMHNYGMLPNFGVVSMQRPNFIRSPPKRVLLTVGSMEFMGVGHTLQLARHDAAAKALKTLSELPAPGKGMPQEESEITRTEDQTTQDEKKEAEKSHVSLVHELAFQRKFPVVFEVIRECGPPHMRTFVTRCTCGDLVTEGDGLSKSSSKNSSAKAMLEKLAALPSLPGDASATKKPKKSVHVKKKPSGLNKEARGDPTYGENIHPVSRLIQIQQSKKEKEPVYTLLLEGSGGGRITLPGRVTEFTFQVTVGEFTCTATSNSKKLAKRKVAENMLQLLGYSNGRRVVPAKPALKAATPDSDSSPASSSAGDKKVTFADDDKTSSMTAVGSHHHECISNGGRQLVPGVILLTPGGEAGKRVSRRSHKVNKPRLPLDKSAVTEEESNLDSNNERLTTEPNSPYDVIRSLAKRLLLPTVGETLSLDVSTISSLNSSSVETAETVGCAATYRERLQWLADKLKLIVQFIIIPRNADKRSQYLSLVTISTVPVLTQHGYGPTIEEAHNASALALLSALVELGSNLDQGSLKTEPS